jgi:glycosyltransferase involved in cell wall biosynthesis
VTDPFPIGVKVAHLTSGHTPFDTRIFYKECKTLVDHKYEVVLIVPGIRDQVVDGVRIRSVPKPKRRWERMTVTAWRVFKAALHERAFLFHVHDPELLPWALLLRLYGKRVIYDMHENVPKAILTRPWVRPAIRAALSLSCRFLERILLPMVHIVYAENSYVSDYSWLNNKSVVILNMPIVDHSSRMAETKYLVPTVGYIGCVESQRGSVVTLEALHILKSEGLRVDWECVGPLEGDHWLTITRLKEELELAGIFLRGYMLPRDGQRIIVRCHIGLAILKAIPNYVDSYPTKMFEYMALGLPVIVSDFPLYREVIEDAKCGLCVNPEDPRQLAKAIRLLVENPQEASEMGRRGQQAVHTKYNWTIEAKKLTQFYKEIERSLQTRRGTRYLRPTSN